MELEIPKSVDPELLEAFRAVITLLPDEYKSQCVLIGGGAMQMHGSPRRTDDLDFVITPEAFYAFSTAAKQSRYFRGSDDAGWRYVADDAEFVIDIEFLAIGGGFVDEPIQGTVTCAGGGLVASMPELLKMKANAYETRKSDRKDLADFRTLVNRMEAKGITFSATGVSVSVEQKQLMRSVAQTIGQGVEEILETLW